MNMRHQPPLFQILFGLVFAGLGWGLLYVFGQVAVLTCVRDGADRISCLQEARWLGKVTVRESEVRDIQGAWVQDNCDSDGCTYRVMLELGSGSQPLTKVYSSGLQRKQQIAGQINAFCQDPGIASLETETEGVWVAVLVTGIFIVVGLGIVFTGARGIFMH